MKTISSKTQFPTLCRSQWARFAWNESETTGRHLPRMLFGIAAILCLCLGFSAAGLHAQGYGTISGTVTDSTGAVIASATVTATQPLTGAIRTVETGKDGEYVFPALLPNAYTVSVTAPGFETHTRTGLVLQADQALTLNVSLKVGSQTQVVSVSGDAPQVDTTTGTLSQVIDESRVVDLPLNGRNAASLITLVAGVVDATNEGNGVNQGNGKTFPAAVVTSSNGTLPNQDELSAGRWQQRR